MTFSWKMVWARPGLVGRPTEKNESLLKQGLVFMMIDDSSPLFKADRRDAVAEKTLKGSGNLTSVPLPI
jgi:hypothetical protein